MCATATPTAKRYTSQSLSLSLPDTACCACTPLTHLPVRAPPSLIHLSCTPLTHPPVIAPPHTLNCLCMHPPCSPPVHAPPSLTRTRLCVHPLHSFSHLTVHTHTPPSLAQWLFCPARHISDPSPNTHLTPACGLLTARHMSAGLCSAWMPCCSATARACSPSRPHQQGGRCTWLSWGAGRAELSWRWHCGTGWMQRPCACGGASRRPLVMAAKAGQKSRECQHTCLPACLRLHLRACCAHCVLTPACSLPAYLPAYKCACMHRCAAVHLRA